MKAQCVTLNVGLVRHSAKRKNENGKIARIELDTVAIIYVNNLLIPALRALAVRHVKMKRACV